MYLNLENAGWWLVHSALGGGLILLLTRGLILLARQPALRQRLAECGLFAALAVSALCWLPAWLIVPWSWTEETVSVQRIEPAVLAVQAVPKEAPPDFIAMLPVPEPALPQPEPRRRIPEVGQVEKAEIVPLVKKLPPIEKPAPVETAASEPEIFSWWPESYLTAALIVLAAIYGLVLLWFLVRLGLALLSLAALRRSSASAPEHVYAVLREMVLRRRLPSLLMSYRKRTPLSFGLIRPTILLPASMCANSDQRALRWVLRHELTHLQRGDAWSSLLCVLARALYFYLPWTWSICRQVRLCQEFLADASAVEEQEAPEYAEFLLTFSKPAALPQVATGISGSSSDLYRRVTMLLEKPVSVQPHTGRRWLLFAGFALMTLAVLVSGLGLQAQAQEKKIIIISDGGASKKAIHVVPLPHFQFQDIAPEKKGKEEKIFIFKHVNPMQIEVEVDVIKLKPEQIKVKALSGKQGVFVEGVPGLSGLQKVQVTPKGKQVEIEIAQPSKDNQLYLYKIHTSGGGLDKAVQKMKNAKTQKEAQAAQKELAEAIEKLMKEIPRQGQFVPATPLVPATPQLFQPKKVKEFKEGEFKVFPGQQVQPFIFDGYASAKPRLGVGLDVPSKILADQLNLPKGQGLVVAEVFPGTPAEKAGLKVNDILLQLGGKVVPSDIQEFNKLVSAAKEDTPINLVILRKGQQQTIKDVKLPKQKKTPAATATPFGGVYQYGFAPAFTAGQNAVMTTVYRTKDRFNCRHQEGSLILTITGALEQNKARVEEIHIQDGGKVSNYSDLNKVPAQYRDKVNHIVDMVNKGIVQVQTQDQ